MSLSHGILGFLNHKSAFLMKVFFSGNTPPEQSVTMPKEFGHNYLKMCVEWAKSCVNKLEELL